MANYAKKFFTRSETESWFVQGVQPWCKEDALMVMLNATPGKSGYGVTYSTASDRAAWDYPNAATIIYHKNATDTQWQGIVLSFAFRDGQTTGCAKYTDATINKLCADMWFLEKLDDQDTIETLIKVERKFKLPAGKQPKDYAAPGVDVMKEVGGFEEM
jgi:formylmethanofuran dehydrogenase subunit E-like metal-binding protein